MKKLFGAAFAAALTFVSPALAAIPMDDAPVVVLVNVGEQRMHVFLDGREEYTWPVSTARSGYYTPTGAYAPIRMEKMWYSRKYAMSPMPHSIFFLGGWAVHGTGEVSELGRPASHGCVRLLPDNARILFGLVQQAGMNNARIIIR